MMSNTFSPKLVLHLGQASASASTVPPIDFGDAGGGSVVSGTPGTAGTPGTVGTPGTSPTTGEVPPAAVPTGPTTPVQNVSAPKGLPPLGSVPMLLMLAGLAVAGGIGWFLRQAGVILFGTGAACAHGLKAGIPDLRKV